MGSYATAPRFLVSAPACPARSGHEHGVGCDYRVAWAINPHMKIGSADSALAVAQHGTFVRLLRRIGAHVTTVPFVHAAYDSVFAKDNAILVRRKGTDYALVAHPRHPERRSEQAARAHALETLGFQVLAPPPVPFEGGDVVVPATGECAFLGHGFRSSPEAVPALERFLDAPVVPLELCDPSLYHLDMALSVLSDGTVLVCDRALTPRSMRLLRSVTRGRLVRIPRSTALRFALNLVTVGRDVVLAARAPGVETLLRQRGLRPHGVALSEFQRAGGSAACLVAQIHDLDRVSRENALSSTAA